VTALSRRRAVRAAKRLGLWPTEPPLATTSWHVAGRSSSEEAPAAQVVHILQGFRRAQRPDLHPVRWERLVEPQAGLPLRRPPRRGHRRAPPTGGPGSRAPLEPWPTTSGVPSWGADRARESAAHRAQLAPTARQGSPRGPATWSAAHAALAHAEPQALAPHQAGSRDPEVTARDGGVEQRWVLLASAPRQAPAPPTVDQPRRQPRAQEVPAGKL
jgi:hypothetical protein